MSRRRMTGSPYGDPEAANQHSPEGRDMPLTLDSAAEDSSVDAKQSLKNPFLSAVCARLRRERLSSALGADDVAVSREVVDGRTLMRVWFRTAGCTFDHQGLCTMCNYGSGTHVPSNLIDQVQAALREHPIDEGTALLISPSGSMFDVREVPESTRQGLLDVVSRTPAAAIICETRSETITEAAVLDFAERTRGKTPIIEMGLESSDPWVLRWSVNKRMSLPGFIDAVYTCKRAGVQTIANVALGSAFLSPAAAIRDAVDTAQWAIASGVDSCVVFPMQVREWTLLGWLWRRGLYDPPSLWALIEVIRSVEMDRPNQLSIAWYRNYNEGLPVQEALMPVLVSPSTCPSCVGPVLGGLDTFRASGEVAVLDSLLIEPCGCRERWIRERGEPSIDLGRVVSAYQAIGKSLAPAWWASNGSTLLSEMDSSFDLRWANLNPSSYGGR